jgi:hypothetical protein
MLNVGHDVFRVWGPFLNRENQAANCVAHQLAQVGDSLFIKMLLH